MRGVQRDMCLSDPFLQQVVDEVQAHQRENPDEELSSYELRDAPRFLLIKDSISKFGEDFQDENRWQKDVWSQALERRSDIPTEVNVEWMM
jgi:hypothetical protein